MVLFLSKPINQLITQHFTVVPCKITLGYTYIDLDNLCEPTTSYFSYRVGLNSLCLFLHLPTPFYKTVKGSYQSEFLYKIKRTDLLFDCCKKVFNEGNNNPLLNVF